MVYGENNITANNIDKINVQNIFIELQTKKKMIKKGNIDEMICVKEWMTHICEHCPALQLLLQSGWGWCIYKELNDQQELCLASELVQWNSLVQSL